MPSLKIFQLFTLFCVISLTTLQAQKPYDGPIPTHIQKDKKWIYRDYAGNRIFDGEYDEAWFFYEGLAVVKQFGSYKYIDLTGKPVLNNMYEVAGDFSEGRAMVKMANTGRFYINKKGERKSEKEYQTLGKFKDGVGIGYRENRYFLIDSTGKEIAGPFNYVDGFREGMSWFSIDRQFGFVNTKGEKVIKPVYRNARSFIDGYAWVQKQDSTFCLIDLKGKEVTPAKKYVNPIQLPYQTKYLIEDVKDGSTIKSRDGKVLLKTKFKIIRWLQKDLFVYNDNKGSGEGVIDIKGKEVIKAGWTDLDESKGDFVIVQKNNKYGIYGLDGKEIIPARYDFSWTTTAGTFMKEGNKYFLYHEKQKTLGKKVYHALPDVPWQFTVPEGYGFIQWLYYKFFIDASGKEFLDREVYTEKIKGTNGKFALKDTYTGDTLTEYIYDIVETQSEGMLPVTINGKYGFFSNDLAKEVIPCIYDEISFFLEGVCAVKKNGKWGYINKTGATVIAFKFDKAWQFLKGEAEVLIGKELFFINHKGEIIRSGNNYYAYDPWEDRPKFNDNALTGTFYLEYNHVIDSPYSTPVKGQKSQELDDPVSIKVTPNTISTQYYHFTVESSGYHNGQRVYNLERNSGNNTYLMFVFFGNGEDRCAFMTRDGMVVYATGPMQFGK